MTNEPSDVVRKTGKSVNASSNPPYLYLNATPVLKLEYHQHAMTVYQNFSIKLTELAFRKVLKFPLQVCKSM